MFKNPSQVVSLNILSFFVPSKDDYSDYSRFYVKPILSARVADGETGLVVPERGEGAVPGTFQRVPYYRWVGGRQRKGKPNT